MIELYSITPAALIGPHRGGESLSLSLTETGSPQFTRFGKSFHLMGVGPTRVRSGLQGRNHGHFHGFQPVLDSSALEVESLNLRQSPQKAGTIFIAHAS